MDNVKVLKEIWDTVSLDADFFEKSIITKYSEPHRFYHTLNHLSDLCSAFSSYCNSDKSLSSQTKCAIYYAIFFHDIVYDTNSYTNEEDSNNIWLNFSENKVDGKTRILVSQMILATKDHKNINENYAISIFLDLDLSILGEPSAQKFEEYEQNIQKEYQHIEKKLYLKKRFEIMNKIALNRYYTRIGNLKWGVYRKRNMAKYANIISYFKYYAKIPHPSNINCQQSDLLKEILIKEYIFKIFFQHNPHIEYLFLKSDCIKYKSHVIKAKHSVKQISQILKININHSIFLKKIIQSHDEHDFVASSEITHGTFLLVKNTNKFKNNSVFYIHNIKLFDYLIIKAGKFIITKQFKSVSANEQLRTFSYQHKIKSSEIEKSIELLKKLEDKYNESIIESMHHCDIFDQIQTEFITNELQLSETFELINYFFEE